MAERLNGELGAVSDDDGASNRQRRRWFVDFESTLTRLDGGRHPCTVYDLSPRGAGVGVAEPDGFGPNDRVEFALPGYGSIAAEVRYRGGGYLGLEFLLEDEEEIEIARYLVSMDRSRRPEAREVKLVGTLRASGADIACTVLDITRLGARIAIDDTRPVNEDTDVLLELRGIGRVAARISALDEREVTLAFLEQLDGDPGEMIAKAEAAP
jgi:PilZ domain